MRVQSSVAIICYGSPHISRITSGRQVSEYSAVRFAIVIKHELAILFATNSCSKCNTVSWLFLLFLWHIYSGRHIQANFEQKKAVFPHIRHFVEKKITCINIIYQKYLCDYVYSTHKNNIRVLFTGLNHITVINTSERCGSWSVPQIKENTRILFLLFLLLQWY